MMDELLERCREGCATARKHGATDAEVVAQRAEEISVTIEKHDLQIARSSLESTFGIRVLVGDRLGFASTNATRDLSAACRDAVTLAKATPGDPHNRFPAPQRLPAVQDLLDERASEFSAEDAVDCASTMLRVAAAVDRRVIVGDGAFSSLQTTRAMANTLGVAASEAASLFIHHVLVTAKEDERVSSMDFQFGACRRAKDIDVAPAVALACRNALDSLGSAPGETFQGVVILSPNAVLDIVVAPLLFQVNARNVLRGLSRWRDHLGGPIASPALSVVDDGTRPGGVASSSFDREGVPHATLSLVERGRLVSFLHNTYSSSALGAINTGHAAGSASSLPMIGPTNLTLAPGTASLEELIADTDQGLVVGRFAGNVDPISGDFSGVAKAAHLLRHGRRAYPVTGTLVAGNAFDALRAILDVSRDTQQIFGFTLPYLRIGGVSVTAG
jgi:PmbA protein